MAYNPDEQEQIDELKAFWSKYGNTILSVLTVVLFAVAGWRAWGWYQSNQSARAAVVYHQLKTAITAGDADRVKSVSATLTDKFGGTAYARMGALSSSQLLIDKSRYDEAASGLQWILDHSDDPSFTLSARLQMAVIHLEQKAYDKGLAVLDVSVPKAFEALFADQRGDILLAKGDSDGARQAFKAAVDAMSASTQVRRLVQLKLDALGEGS